MSSAFSKRTFFFAATLLLFSASPICSAHASPASLEARTFVGSSVLIWASAGVSGEKTSRQSGSLKIEDLERAYALERYASVASCKSVSADHQLGGRELNDAAFNLYMLSQSGKRLRELQQKKVDAEKVVALTEFEESTIKRLESRRAEMLFRGADFGYLMNLTNDINELKKGYANTPDRISARESIKKYNSEIENLVGTTKNSDAASKYEAARLSTIEKTEALSDSLSDKATDFAPVLQIEKSIKAVQQCPSFDKQRDFDLVALSSAIASKFANAVQTTYKDAKLAYKDGNNNSIDGYKKSISIIYQSQILMSAPILSAEHLEARNYLASLVAKRDAALAAERQREKAAIELAARKEREFHQLQIGLSNTREGVHAPKPSDLVEAIVTGYASLGSFRREGKSSTLSFVNIFNSELYRQTISVENLQCIKVKRNVYKCDFIVQKTIEDSKDGSLSGLFFTMARSYAGAFGISTGGSRERRSHQFVFSNGQWSSADMLVQMRDEERVRRENAAKSNEKSCRTESVVENPGALAGWAMYELNQKEVCY